MPRPPLAAAGLVLLPLLASAPTVPAHDEGYVGGNDCSMQDACLLPPYQSVCTITTCVGLLCPGHLDSVGAVCFGAGHIEPNAFGQATISIRDRLVHPAAGFACQNQDHDAFCGESGDYGVGFCGSVVLEPPWNPGRFTIVYLGGPLLNRGLCEGVASGHVGQVSHA